MSTIVASTVKANDILESTEGGATFFLIRAWINWQNAGTALLIDSGGVSSGTDTGTGAWQTNFSTAFSNALYASAGMNGENGSTYNNAAIAYNTGAGGNGNTTTYRRCSAENADGGYTDYNNNNVIFCGYQ